MGRKLIVIALAVLVAVVSCDDPARPALDDGPGPEPDDALLQRQDVIPNHYIVVFDDAVTDPPGLARGLARAHGLELRHTYAAALRGFAAVVPPGRVDALRADPRVRYVTPDRLHQVDQGQGLPTGIDRIEADRNPRLAPGDSVDVDIAILDTGVDSDHPDLNVWQAVSFAGNPEDGYGHGTHVAGTAAALNDGSGVVGVAPGARIWSVKVCNNGGSCKVSDIIAGVNYVAANASEIEVANMSLGGPGSDDGQCGASIGDAEHEAICGAADSGVVVVVSAGNRNSDAAGYAPASYDEVITVSALADFDGRPGGLGLSTCRNDLDDSFANFSNYGGDVDVMAPGVCIESSWKGGGYNTISGTSMAAPHVTGVVALFVEGRDRDYNGDKVIDRADVYFVRDALVAMAIPQSDGCGLTVFDDDDGSVFPEPVIFANALDLGGDGSCGDEIPASGPDVAVAGVIAPGIVNTGSTVQVNVTVENAGDEDAAGPFNVTLAWDNGTAHGDILPSQEVPGLPAGHSTGLVFSWDTQGLGVGTYTLTASHDYDDGSVGNNTLAASVALGATMHVGNLDRASTRGSKGGTWRAWARITVHTANEGLPDGVTVSGHWDPGYTGGPLEGSCTPTDPWGMCEVSLDGIPNRQGNVVFTIDALTDGSGTLQYDASGNHDDDGNSNGTSIRVFFSNSDDYKK